LKLDVVLLSQEGTMKIHFFAAAIISIPLALGIFPLSGSDYHDSGKMIGTWKGSSINRYHIVMVFKLEGGYEQRLYCCEGVKSDDEENTCVWSGYGNYRVERDAIIIRITHSSDNVPVKQSFRLLKYSQSEMMLQDAVSGKKLVVRRQR
jgi:hypothetical protein